MRNTKIALVIAVAAVCTLPAMAGPHHRDHHGNDGVRLAANIIGLVNTALKPKVVTVPVAVTPPPVVVTHPAPVIHCPPPPPRHHRPLPPPRARHGHHKGGHGKR